jgi:hypothetical protein
MLKNKKYVLQNEPYFYKARENNTGTVSNNSWLLF